MLDRGADLSWLSQYPTEAEVCFPPLSALEVVSSKVQASVLVVSMRPSLCTRPGALPWLDRINAAERQRVEGALDGIGAALSATVTRLTGLSSRVWHTPVGEPPEAAVAALSQGTNDATMRIRLLDDDNCAPWMAFDAFIDVDVTSYSDDGDRRALHDSLSDVLGAAVEVLDTMAHGEMLQTKSQRERFGAFEATPAYWVRHFLAVLYSYVQRGVRDAITISAVAEMKRYSTPPAAVLKILTATLVLLAEHKGVGVLPPFDKNKLNDWKGVRSLIHALEPEAIVRTILHFHPAGVTSKLWARVNSLLEKATLREAMRSSAPLAALYRWIKCARLLSQPALLEQDLASRAATPVEP